MEGTVTGNNDDRRTVSAKTFFCKHIWLVPRVELLVCGIYDQLSNVIQDLEFREM